MSELRERIARAIKPHAWDRSLDWYLTVGAAQDRNDSLEQARRVIAALGLTEERDANVIGFRYDDRSHHWETRHRYVTSWERVDE